MRQEIENFVRYSIRYQLLLAQRVASICNMKIYIFDSNGFFEPSQDLKIEIIDGVSTVFKQGQRAVLSVAVKESFCSDQELFLQFVDENVAQKDEIGLYVNAPVVVVDEVEQPSKVEEVGLYVNAPVVVVDEVEQPSKVEEVGVDEVEQPSETEEVGVDEVDLTDISDAIKKLDSVL